MTTTLRETDCFVLDLGPLVIHEDGSATDYHGRPVPGLHTTDANGVMRWIPLNAPGTLVVIDWGFSARFKAAESFGEKVAIMAVHDLPAADALMDGSLSVETVEGLGWVPTSSDTADARAELLEDAIAPASR